ncbi:MAG: ester cyclase [Nitrospirae bacterium]|nr:ester cyclase [Nitrospirota bacterium]
MSRSRNVRLIETWYYRMWNRWDKSAFEEILTPDIAFRGSLGQVKRGYEGLSEYMDFIRTAFPDFTNRIEDIISEGEKAFARLTYIGTHAGELFGVAPTHQEVTYAGAGVFSFEGEKIREVWVLGDIHGLLRQLTKRDGI